MEGGAASRVRPVKVAVGAAVGRELGICEAKEVEVARPIYSRVLAARGSFRSDPTTAPVDKAKEQLQG
jgi:hypothetical protein